MIVAQNGGRHAQFHLVNDSEFLVQRFFEQKSDGFRRVVQPAQTDNQAY
jgi:hypothetical protein